MKYNGYGACILSLEDIEEKKQVVKNRRKDTKAKKLV